VEELSPAAAPVNTHSFAGFIPSGQGLTLVPFSAHRKRFLWERGLHVGVVYGVSRGC